MARGNIAHALRIVVISLSESVNRESPESYYRNPSPLVPPPNPPQFPPNPPCPVPQYSPFLIRLYGCRRSGLLIHHKKDIAPMLVNRVIQKPTPLKCVRESDPTRIF